MWRVGAVHALLTTKREGLALGVYERSAGRMFYAFYIYVLYLFI
jgi:hypothetical protein